MQKDEQIVEISREVVELKSERERLQVHVLSLESRVAELTVENTKAQSVQEQFQTQVDAASR